MVGRRSRLDPMSRRILPRSLKGANHSILGAGTSMAKEQAKIDLLKHLEAQRAASPHPSAADRREAQEAIDAPLVIPAIVDLGPAIESSDLLPEGLPAPPSDDERSLSADPNV
jgi:hypothetical protein